VKQRVMEMKEDIEDGFTGTMKIIMIGVVLSLLIPIIMIITIIIKTIVRTTVIQERNYDLRKKPFVDLVVYRYKLCCGKRIIFAHSTVIMEGFSEFEINHFEWTAMTGIDVSYA